jgi:GAF domain-containing protein
MADGRLFETLATFASDLTRDFDVTEMLFELSEAAVSVLDAEAAGVSLAEAEGALKLSGATTQAAAELEGMQQKLQEGPCMLAFQTGTPTVIGDLRQESRWNQYRDAAEHAGVRAVLGIPMQSHDVAVGALNVYDATPRQWTDSDIGAAQVLANMATSYVLYAGRLRERERTAEQLQGALDSRVLIEQAKGLLAGERGIGLDEAFEIMRRYARSNGRKLHDVASTILTTDFRP